MAYHNSEFYKLSEDRHNPRKMKKTTWKLTRRQRKSLIWLAIIYFLLISMLFGTWGTAYAAMDSLPNEALYAVKLMGENLELRLTTDESARISLLTTYMNRRMDEATILASQGEPVPEQVTTLIVEYQDEIVALTTIPDEPMDPVIGIIKRPQDQDNVEGGEDEHDGIYAGDPFRNQKLQPPTPTPLPDDQANNTADPMIVDLTTTKSGANGNSGKMNTTQTRSGSSNGSGQEYIQEYSSGPDSGPDNGPSPYDGPGQYYGPGGNTDIVPQLPSDTTSLMGNDSNQPSENKGNKP